MFASKDTLLTRPSGYNIARSVRTRSSASAYFNRTFSTGNRKTFTFSAWVKKAVVGNSTAAVLLCSTDNSTSTGWLHFNTAAIGSTDALTFQDQLSSTELITTQLFRDPSAWYHIILAVDTTQATASNRAKLYVNGTQVTSFSTATYPTQNADTNFNRPSTFSHTIGTQVAGSRYFDGYLTEINFVDGQQLTPSSFGETDSITGVWKPKAYSGTYGTNGFELNFSDNSNNTAATIGKDYSGNGNNWTPNNISVTAGVTYDSMTDVPTLTSATAANYCVLNPLDVNGMTITNGNLLASSTGATWKSTRSSMAMSSGKWYCEVTVTAGNTPIDCSIGVGSSTLAIASYGEWTSANPSVTYSSGDGSKWLNGTNSAYGSSYTTNDVVGIAFDADALTVTFYKNNTSQGAITTSWSAGLTWLFEITLYGRGGGTTSAAFNFGQRPFSYTPPTGFVALNTYNLPASTIKNGAAYMAATLWTGNSSTQSISNAVNGVSFQPDFVWIKKRSGADDHGEFDSVRGVQKRLQPNLTNAENTETTALSSFDSGGFTLGTNGQFNGSTFTYVGWQWKAGGTSASNTNGTITSTVSVGATQGFSVVTYTGTGVTATVGHGLGVAPQMVIVKNRAAAESWRVGHSFMNGGSSPWNYYMNLNATSAQVASSALWNNTAPTSTVFTISNDSAVSGNGQSHVAYCFAPVAGYSAFGSYTGNGSADGPFVYTGFRPRWVMFKNTTTGAGWLIYDSSRNTYNLTDLYLQANQSNAEAGNSTDNPLDFLSNGFKLRYSNSATNASAEVYIYAAFAENPFKNSLAR